MSTEIIRDAKAPIHHPGFNSSLRSSLEFLDLSSGH